MTKLVISGGGTGGHIYPALSIADGIRRRWPDTEILYIGAKSGMESRIVPEAGYSFRGIKAAGWQGRKPLALINALKSDHSGRKEAADLISAWKPQAVIGTGGFVCLPVAMAAVQKHIPVYIHEQNAYPGMTNRMIANWARGIMLSFEESAKHFPYFSRRKTSVTGLPVRESITGADRSGALAFFQLKEDKKTILVAGGSLGAEHINRAMLYVIEQLYGSTDTQVLFATGRRDYEQMVEELTVAGMTRDAMAGAESNIRMLPYIDRMDLAYAAADIFIGRAGASTLAEITLCGLPAVLIPYPRASENHQAYNAASLAARGGAMLMEDQGLSGSALISILGELLNDGDRLQAMAACSNQAAYGRALEDILDILAEVM